MSRTPATKHSDNEHSPVASRLLVSPLPTFLSGWRASQRKSTSAKATTLTVRHPRSSTESSQASTMKNWCRKSSPWMPLAHSDMWWQHAALTRLRGQPHLYYGPLKQQELYPSTRHGRRRLTKWKQRHFRLQTRHLLVRDVGNSSMAPTVACHRSNIWSLRIRSRGQKDAPLST